MTASTGIQGFRALRRNFNPKLFRSASFCLLPGPSAAFYLNPRPLISFASYLILYCTLSKSPDLLRHVETCAGLFLQKKRWPISFNPRPVSRSQRNAQPRCKNTNAPSLLLYYVNMRLLDMILIDLYNRGTAHPIPQTINPDSQPQTLNLKP